LSTTPISGKIAIYGRALLVKGCGEFFRIFRNSTSRSVDRRVKGEMSKNKRLNKTVEKSKLTLTKGQE